MGNPSCTSASQLLTQRKRQQDRNVTLSLKSLWQLPTVGTLLQTQLEHSFHSEITQTLNITGCAEPGHLPGVSRPAWMAEGLVLEVAGPRAAPQRAQAWGACSRWSRSPGGPHVTRRKAPCSAARRESRNHSRAVAGLVCALVPVHWGGHREDDKHQEQEE